jgi:hypothetical protein
LRTFDGFPFASFGDNGMGRKKKEVARADESQFPIDPGFLGDIRSLIESSRSHVARVINSAMVMTYWALATGLGARYWGRSVPSTANG